MSKVARIPAGDAMLESMGDRVRRRRRELGWSQVELAHRANVSQQTITALETGATERSRYLPDIAEALGVDEEWLQTGIGGGLGTANSASECLVRPVPVLDAQSAANPEHIGATSEWVVIAGDAASHYGEGSFALQLGPAQGALLADEGPFQSGDMVICDTQATPRPGDYAVVALEEREEVDTGQLRQLHDGSWEVLPLNPLYRAQGLKSRDRIVAVIRELRRSIR